MPCCSLNTAWFVCVCNQSDGHPRRNSGRTYPEIDNTVVQTSVKQDTLELHVLGLRLWGLWAVRVVDGERKHGLESGNEMQLHEPCISTMHGSRMT